MPNVFRKSFSCDPRRVKRERRFSRVATREQAGRTHREDFMISARALKTLALGASVLAAITLPSAAETMTMWSRAAAAAPAQGMIDLWNSTHEDKIELTVIPD